MVPEAAIFLPDIILLAEKKENLRSVQRLLRRFERTGPDVRSLPELIKLLDHKQETVRLLAIKFLGLAGKSAKDAIPALEKMRDDPSAEVRKQAEAACKQIKTNSASSPRKAARNQDVDRLERRFWVQRRQSRRSLSSTALPRSMGVGQHRRHSLVPDPLLRIRRGPFGPPFNRRGQPVPGRTPPAG